MSAWLWIILIIVVLAPVYVMIFALCQVAGHMDDKIEKGTGRRMSG